MPKAIDQRLASLIGQEEIKTAIRVERLTRKIGVRYNRMGRDLLRLVAVPDDDTDREIDRIMGAAFQDVSDMTLKDFTAEIHASYAGAAKAIVKVMPWGWFRAIDPMVMEAEEPAVPMSKGDKREWIVGHIFPDPTPEKVNELLGHVGPDGQGWADRLDHWNSVARNDIRKALVSTFSDPDTIGIVGARKLLEPVVGNVRYKAQRIARTEGRRMGELANQEAYADVAELIDSMQMIAVIDAHTRPAHIARNGRIYKQREDGRYVAASGEVLPDLPDAPNCRCHSSPILKVPAEIEADSVVRLQLANAAKAVIPDPAAYVQWWVSASTAEKRLAVGARRFSVASKRLEDRGLSPEPDWMDFLDPDGSLVSVQRLKRQTWKAWDGRKAKVSQMISDREQAVKQAISAGGDMPQAG